MNRIVFAFLLATLPMLAHAGEVVDLGQLQILGKMRGPEVNVIDSSRLHSSTAESFIRWQLQNMELKAKAFDAPFAEVVPPKGGKK